ncbi:rod shape-determining protein MreB [Sedimentibacter acidaminivorans]|uniref:Cell shape-determining protein MreB n=1 Tax=Sedimentibacter acidaminivorans TaxID=913099 RepID=A0ABS4GB78_9FIRM|nr:rod shape-determining protein [Sedimentibacter acidaminivorans]MBP1924943.1 rod shape-determining protein MreB [Sedimentibacter acidaminivorans]
MGFINFFTQNIGIDLGTSNTLVYVNDKGIIVNEPSVVAINVNTNTVRAVGNDAKYMLDRTPKTINAIRPLQNGVIADFEITSAMIKYFINKSLNNRRFMKSNIVICVPVGVTSIERRAVEEVAYDSGAKKVKLVEEPMAAAIGAGLLVHEAVGNMIIDIGGGTTEIAIVSLGGIVVSDSLRIAGDDIDANIKEYIKLKYKMEIGLVSAENIKKVIGNASNEFYNKEKAKVKKDKAESDESGEVDINESKKETNQMEIRGRDIVSGLPISISITSDEIRTAIIETVNSIVGAIKRVLERTPPELAADLYENGIYLTGGGALLKGLDIYIEKETGLKVHVADNPLECVALGAGKICENM